MQIFNLGLRIERNSPRKISLTRLKEKSIFQSAVSQRSVSKFEIKGYLTLAELTFGVRLGRSEVLRNSHMARASENVSKAAVNTRILVKASH